MTIKSILAVVAVILTLSITLLTATTSFKVMSTQGTSSSSNNNSTIASSITVHAGGGNSTAPLTAFVPQQIEVNVGQSVTWDNPSTVAEPHSYICFG